MMDLSVIIVTRNTCALTCDAVRSVLASQVSLNQELFVVDNGSTDGTDEAIARQFPTVHYLRSATNLGFARATNWAGGNAQGEFILLLNSDAKLSPDTLVTGVSWMRAHPECGVAGGQLLHADGTLQNSIANFPSLATELLNKSLLRWLFPNRFPGKEQRWPAPRQVETIVGAFFLTRKKLWLALGGMDERFFFFLEETDFCLRAQRAGGLVFHLPQLKIWHGQGQSAKSIPAAARIEYWRSRYRYFAKNHGRLTLLVLRVGLFARLVADWLASACITAVTLGSSLRWNNKFAVYQALLIWHLRFCPGDMGLPR